MQAKNDRPVGKLLLWSSAIGATLLASAFIWIMYVSVQVNRYIDQWFSQNIAYAGKHSSGFSSGLGMQGGSLADAVHRHRHPGDGKSLQGCLRLYAHPG